MHDVRPLILVFVLALACGGPESPPSGGSSSGGDSAASSSEPTEPAAAPQVEASHRAADGSLVGVLSVDDLLRDDRFREVYDATSPSEEAMALANTPPGPGAHLDIVLGTWCPDSRREVSQFLRDYESVDFEAAPFTLRIIGVDRRKQAPAGLVDDLEIQYVPTFIVRVGGEEVGRVVEYTPSGMSLSVALSDLMSGHSWGIISHRPPGER